ARGTAVDAHDHGILDGGVAAQDRLDLAGIDLAASQIDEVVHSALEDDLPAVQSCEVAGDEAAAVQPGCAAGMVAAGDCGRADGEIAVSGPLTVQPLELDPLDRRTDGAALGSAAVAVEADPPALTG